MKNFFEFVKKETVLCVSFLLALFSMFFVRPSADYIGYIDFRTLGILLSLMLVVAGVKKAGVFDAASYVLTSKTSTTLGLSYVLILLCFFLSMLITNDVALITFVPFAIYTLKACNQSSKIIPVVVLQTVAANLGSMLTPLGNPQNLYLYQLADYEFLAFVRVILPYALLSLVMICALAVILCRGGKLADENHNMIPDGVEEVFDLHKNADKDVSRKEALVESDVSDEADSKFGCPHIRVKDAVIFAVLFVLCLLVVFRILNYLIALGVILIYLLIFDRKLLTKADYSLLFTFIFFFIFTGNLGNISAVRDLLTSLVSGHETITAVVASQAISNVPAALLLSGFTSNYDALLIGVNLGGLGTLIASMASLISYKAIVASEPELKGRYFTVFTVINVVMLMVLVGFSIIVR